MTHDDDDWLAGLAGRGVDDGDAVRREAAREGRLLRDAMMRWAPVVDPVQEADAVRLAKLIAHARAAGLFEPRTPRAPRPTIGRRLRAWWGNGASIHPRGWATAFVVVAIVATAYVLRPGPGEVVDDTVRSAPDSVTLLRATNPEATRRDIVDALSHQGIRSSTYSRFGRLGLDADLPMPLSGDVQAILARHRIPPPTDGVLRVEIEQAR